MKAILFWIFVVLVVVAIRSGADASADLAGDISGATTAMVSGIFNVLDGVASSGESTPRPRG